MIQEGEFFCSFFVSLFVFWATPNSAQKLLLAGLKNHMICQNLTKVDRMQDKYLSVVQDKTSCACKTSTSSLEGEFLKFDPIVNSHQLLRTHPVSS